MQLGAVTCRASVITGKAATTEERGMVSSLAAVCLVALLCSIWAHVKIGVECELNPKTTATYLLENRL